MTNEHERSMPQNLIDAIYETADTYERGLRRAVDIAGLLDETVAHTAMVGYLTGVRDMTLLAAYTPPKNPEFFRYLETRTGGHAGGHWTVDPVDGDAPDELEPDIEKEPLTDDPD